MSDIIKVALTVNDIYFLFFSSRELFYRVCPINSDYVYLFGLDSRELTINGFPAHLKIYDREFDIHMGKGHYGLGAGVNIIVHNYMQIIHSSEWLL